MIRDAAIVGSAQHLLDFNVKHDEIVKYFVMKDAHALSARWQAARGSTHQEAIMIRTEKEYQKTIERIRAQEERLREYEAQLSSEGLPFKEVERALDPIRSFHSQLVEEAAYYERLKRGQFDELHNLQGLGQLLISLRIAQGLTQRELADRLGVHEAQVSRDERNEYHGITLERAGRILDAIGANIRSRVELTVSNAS